MCFRCTNTNKNVLNVHFGVCFARKSGKWYAKVIAFGSNRQQKKCTCAAAVAIAADCSNKHLITQFILSEKKKTISALSMTIILCTASFNWFSNCCENGDRKPCIKF